MWKMCNCIGGGLWLYAWRVEYLAKNGKKVVNEGVYPSGLDSSHEAEKIVNYAYNKTLGWGEKTGNFVKKFLSCNYKIIQGGSR